MRQNLWLALRERVREFFWIKHFFVLHVIWNAANHRDKTSYRIFCFQTSRKSRQAPWLPYSLRLFSQSVSHLAPFAVWRGCVIGKWSYMLGCIRRLDSSSVLSVLSTETISSLLIRCYSMALWNISFFFKVHSMILNWYWKWRSSYLLCSSSISMLS